MPPAGPSVPTATAAAAAAAAATSGVLVKASLVGDDAAGPAGVRDVAAPSRPPNFAAFKAALVAAFPGLDAAACSLFVLFPGAGGGGGGGIGLGLGGRRVEVQIDADSDVEAIK